jgi:predicted HTH domain antitoxin
MGSLTIPFSDDLWLALGRSPGELQQELRFLLALKLFELQRLTAGKAAEIAGLGKLAFLDQAAKVGVASIALEGEQLDPELHDD